MEEQQLKIDDEMFQWETMRIIDILKHDIRELAILKGFSHRTIQREVGTMVALLHSECSEILEAFRHGNPTSEKIPEFSAATEEAADLFIRLMDFCAEYNLDLGRAVFAKIAMNKSRPHKHGKAF